LAAKSCSPSSLRIYPGHCGSPELLEAARRDAAPVLQRIVVAIDPSGGGEDADETGIVACGVDSEGRGWVLGDASGHYQPAAWARRAVELYRSLSADRIVAEVNFGGAMVEATIRAVDPNVPFRAVHASRGKVARAEPVSALYEQGRVFHLGVFPSLEDQMSTFTSNSPQREAGSPDRVDALVWALTDLIIEPMKGFGIFEYYRKRALALQ
jgi:predicted phage terminase large subunit-like protein